MTKNVQPGSQIFEEQPGLNYAVFNTFLLANVFLLPLG